MTCYPLCRSRLEGFGRLLHEYNAACLTGTQYILTGRVFETSTMSVCTVLGIVLK